jgi:hypothetical protein
MALSDGKPGKLGAWDEMGALCTQRIIRQPTGDVACQNYAGKSRFPRLVCCFADNQLGVEPKKGEVIIGKTKGCEVRNNGVSLINCIPTRREVISRNEVKILGDIAITAARQPEVIAWPG